MHPNRRRKKRSNYGIRTVEISRGPNGFGFTISGQQPCILSCIVKDSPADYAGLRAGNFLISVNDVSVSKTTHDSVVNLIGNCIGPIKMTIAENFYSDSSDDELEVNRSFVHSRKIKHKPRTSKFNRSIEQQQQQVNTRKCCENGLIGYLGVIDNTKQYTTGLKGLIIEDQGGPIEYKALVGYLGTIEMPKQLSPETRLTTVCNCIKKLRQEKRSPTAVLMTVLPTCLTLKNSSNHILAIYPTNRVVYVGSARDKDSRYFGLVTSAISNLNIKEDNKKSNSDIGISNSCHIFVTDPKLIEHSIHLHKAEAFGIICSIDPITGRCLEFPKDSLYIVSLIQSMYKLQCDAATGGHLIANSPQPSASSNSDSGIGFRDDFNTISDRIVLVEFPAKDDTPIRSKPNDLLKFVLNNEKKPLNINNTRTYDSVSIKNTFETKNINEIEARLNNFTNPINKPTRNVSPSSFTSSDDNNKNVKYEERPIDVPLNYQDDDISMSSNKSLDFNLFKTPSTVLFERKTKQLKLANSCDNLDNFDKKRKLNRQKEILCKNNYSYEELNNFDFGQQLGYGSLNDLLFVGRNGDNGREIARSEPDVRVRSGRKMNFSMNNDETKENSAEIWSQSFEKLLEDNEGVKAFAEFLKMEFSSENIDFWMSVEKYRTIPNGIDKKNEAKRIFKEHISVGASEAVNVDAQARQFVEQLLHEAPSNIFDQAQKQVLNLMKFDSYPRFLKSDLYKKCCTSSSVVEGKTSISTPTTPSTIPVKLKKSLSNAEDRRRKSLLPWHRKTRSKSKDRNDINDNNSNNNKEEVHSSRSSLTSLDLAISNLQNKDDSGTILCRVSLGNYSTTVVQIKPNENVHDLVERLLEKRGLNYNSFEVYTDRHPKPVDINEISTILAGCEVKIQQRVVFKLDLPNRKTVSVKSKATKMIIDVLKPILHKYDFTIDQIILINPKDGCSIDIKQQITLIDGLKLQVQLIDTKHGNYHKTNKLVEITNQVFEGILQEKSECTTTKTKSDKGSIKSEDLGSEHSSSYFGKFLRRDSTQQQQELKQKKSLIPRSKLLINTTEQLKNKPLIAKWKTGVNKLQVSPCSESECNELVEGLTRAQKSRLEDQRGTEINFELPDFLKDKENDRKHQRIQQQQNNVNYENQFVRPDDIKLNDESPVNTPNKQMKLNNTIFTIKSSQDFNKITSKELKIEPPPLPPKPKIVPLKPPNWGQNEYGKVTDRSVQQQQQQKAKQSLFLEQPSSSFV